MRGDPVILHLRLCENVYKAGADAKTPVVHSSRSRIAGSEAGILLRRGQWESGRDFSGEVLYAIGLNSLCVFFLQVQ